MIKRLFVIMISLFIGIVGVNAANGNAPEGSVNFEQFKAEYDKGIIPTTINGEGIITLYGFADCDSSGCSIIYNMSIGTVAMKLQGEWKIYKTT